MLLYECVNKIRRKIQALVQYNRVGGSEQNCVEFHDYYDQLGLIEILKL